MRPLHMRSVPRWIGVVLLLLLTASAWVGLERCRRAPAGALVPPRREPARMSVRALRTLPALGERLARAVIVARERSGTQPFRWEDVPGLGPVRVEALRRRMQELGFPPEPFESGAARYPAPAVDVRATALMLLSALAGCGDEPSRAEAPAAGTRVPESGGEARHEVLRLAGAEVHVRALGAAGPDGVLFLHGARYSSAEWLALGSLARVAGRGLRALALDWPGSGDSPSVSPAPDPAELLAELLTVAGLERVVLVAPSRGGSQALALLARGEPRVLGLLALAPAVDADFEPPAGPFPLTRLLWGEADEVADPEVGRALAARLGGARFELVPGAGHACYLAAPAHFHAVLDGLLDELGWSAR